MAQAPQKKPSLGSNPNLSLLLGAGALIAVGLIKRSKSGAAMAAAGSFLAYKGFTEDNPKPFTAKARFRVNTTTDEAYKLWRDFAGLPRFMTHIESVEVLDGTRSRWTAKPPARLSATSSSKTPLTWTAELTEDTPGKRIAWRTTADSAIQTDGFAEFADDPLGRGIFVTTQSRFNLPAGPLASTLYSLLGKNPDFIAREDLRHLKSLLEAGEIATVEGQSHGTRGLKGNIERALYREASNPPEGQAQDAPSEQPAELQHA